jgi:4-hydroxythreonine-4-phosphate dehydrogenase
LKRHPSIAITTGDSDGIGFEITAKALKQLSRSTVSSKVRYVVFGSRHGNLQWRRQLSRLANVDLVLKNGPPRNWVRTAAEGCLNGEFDALVTGPMSKQPTGHTEILADVANVKNPLMAFLGTQFHVVLATGHIAVTDLRRHLNPRQLKWAIEKALELRAQLGLKKPVGILAVNPHAGEGGLIGKDDLAVARVIKSLSRKQNIVGPLVPDAAFMRSHLGRHSIFVAQYHDQGLIPFKALHSFSEGTQVTLGIPFVRTSVDHGTAKDIFNKNKADAGSMVAAIQWARRLL